MPPGTAADAFPQYVVEANEIGLAFYVFVLAYTLVAFVLIWPLVKIGQHLDEIGQDAVARDDKVAVGSLQQQQVDGNEESDEDNQDDGTKGQQQYKNRQGDQTSHHPSDNKSSDVTNRTTSEGHSTLCADESPPSHRADDRRVPSTPTPVLAKPRGRDHPHRTTGLPVPPARMPSLSKTCSDRSIASRKSRSHVRVQSTTAGGGGTPAMDQHSAVSQHARRPSTAGSGGALSFVLRGLDRVASAEYPDQDPEFASQLSGSAMIRRQAYQRRSAHDKPRSELPSRASSAAPSVATTSRIHSRQKRQRTQRSRQGASAGDPRLVSPRIPTATVWDVNGRRWKTRRPIGRVDTIRNAIRRESASMMSYDGPNPDRRRHRHYYEHRRHPTSHRNGTMSDVASGVLVQEPVPSGFVIHPSIRHRISMMSQRHHIHPSTNRPRIGSRTLSRAGSFSTLTGSEPSIMPPIVDDLTPNDAADADDPGRGNVFIGIEEDRLPAKPASSIGFGVNMGCATPVIEGILGLAELDDEASRLLRLSLPLTIGAMAEPLFRLVSVAFLSNYLGSDEMIAFLLVVLFARLTTEEVTGAIIDSLSSFVQQAIYSGQPDAAFMSGQFVQLAMILQLIFGFPLLLAWVLYMDDVVFWLVQSSSISQLAGEYTFIIVFNYLVQAIGRTFTVIFHIGGHEHFESIIDFCSHVCGALAIACIVSFKDGADLNIVAGVQLSIGTATTLIKICYPITMGWTKPFHNGLVKSFAPYRSFTAFKMMILSTFPLLVGSVLEFGEWELLTIFLRHLGPAEVATWALLGNVWEILEAATEGIGEAASIRVAYLLSIPCTERTSMLASKVMYMSIVASIVVTSVMYMAGRNIAVLLTTDRTIQHLLNNTVGLLGIANITMAFAQASWSLIGAQGRFRLATIIMFFCRWFVTMPVALAVIFGYFLELNAVVGSVIVGYATASCALAFVVLRSDWGRLAKVMQEVSPSVGDEADNDLAALEGLDLEDFDDDSESDDGDEDEDDSGDDDDSVTSESDDNGEEGASPRSHSH